MLTDNKLIRHLHHLRIFEKLLIQGEILAVILTVVQLWLEGTQNGFMAYMPPIGFAFFLIISYLIQPLLLGVLNIFLINALWGTKGWQVGFWLNGIFLLLVFSTVNLVFETTLGLPFGYVAAIDIVLLALPFGCIARFSNGGWKKPIN
jgi:hypothetical protein